MARLKEGPVESGRRAGQPISIPGARPTPVASASNSPLRSRLPTLCDAGKMQYADEMKVICCHRDFFLSVPFDQWARGSFAIFRADPSRMRDLVFARSTSKTPVAHTTATGSWWAGHNVAVGETCPRPRPSARRGPAARHTCRPARQSANLKRSIVPSSSVSVTKSEIVRFEMKASVTASRISS